MSKLILVPTPVGNLDDITLRALKVLKSADFILAEDTRTSGFLLKHFEISNKLQSYHKFNEHKALSKIIDQIKSHETVALMTDAGTPGISDPGYLLVRECIQNDIEVECLPGATAFVPALVVSGFPTDRFCFEGFLPQKKGRQKKLQSLQDEERTIIFYESPHRLIKALEQIKEFIGERQVAVVREISKIHEEVVRGSIDEVILHYQTNVLKGEIVLLVAGKE